MEIWFHEMGLIGWTVLWIVLGALIIGLFISLSISIKERKASKKKPKIDGTGPDDRE